MRQRTRYFFRTEELGSSSTRESHVILKSSCTLKVTVDFCLFVCLAVLFCWWFFFSFSGGCFILRPLVPEAASTLQFQGCNGLFCGLLGVLKELFSDGNFVGNA